MRRIILAGFCAISINASAASLTCFDEMSFGQGKWMKIDLNQRPNGKFDVTIESSTGASDVIRNMECNLAVIGSSPALVDGGCERSNQNLDFTAGLYDGTMSLVRDLSKTLGTAFKCERVKKLEDGFSWSGAGEFGVDTSSFQSRQSLF